MLGLAVVMSAIAVSRAIRVAAYETAAATVSAEPNNAFSHPASTASPANSSRHDNAGSAALVDADDGVSTCSDCPPGPNPRMVAAPAIPTASNVITVNAPLATDFSARHSVMITMNQKH